MYTSRRTLLKQLGLGIAGLGILPFKNLAAPISNLNYPGITENSPLRLSMNENPYGPSPMARTAMAAAILNSNRYNWNTTGELISALASTNKVADENILIGPGSTEILDLIVQSASHKKGSFIIANPSYGSWTKIAEDCGLKKTTVPLTSDKKHNLSAMLKAIQPDTQLIYICNPNNPTGTVCNRKELVSFIQEATERSLVMIDEAYIHFSNEESLSGLASQNRNLIVVKTFSKIYGLAGARIGYAIGHKETIDRISNLQSWANGGVCIVSRAAAIASLKDNAFVSDCILKNNEARKYCIDQMDKLNISSIPSHTNFIYFSLENYKKDFFALLKSNNIEGTDIYEENGKWSRITVGTMDEMEKFISAIS
jgi:histidinol-phosphate aminotransferase